MEVSPCEPLDWEALADVGSRLGGRLDAADFDRRLAAALGVERAEGRVDYALHVRHLADGAVGVSGDLHAELIARCQRCLESFEIALDLGPRIAFSPAGMTSAPAEGWEAVEAGWPPSLAALIEEELLLGLPLAPRHPDADCAAAAGASLPGAETQWPFAGLAGALKKRRERGG